MGNESIISNREKKMLYTVKDNARDLELCMCKLTCRWLRIRKNNKCALRQFCYACMQRAVGCAAISGYISSIRLVSSG